MTVFVADAAAGLAARPAIRSILRWLAPLVSSVCTVIHRCDFEGVCLPLPAATPWSETGSGYQACGRKLLGIGGAIAVAGHGVLIEMRICPTWRDDPGFQCAGGLGEDCYTEEP